MQDSWGATALMYALHHGKLDCAELLLDREAHIPAKDGNTSKWFDHDPGSDALSIAEKKAKSDGAYKKFVKRIKAIRQ